MIKTLMQPTALEKQLSFLREIDRLKSVIRQSPLLDNSRKENSAEHSWHLAMYALLLNQYASSPVNTNRVVQMLLLHDIVEIDVGDIPIHSGSSSELQAAQEARAAARLFGLLPPQQGNEFLALWQEFERAETEDAKFAKALDRFQPLLVNVFTGGGTWAQNSVVNTARDFPTSAEVNFPTLLCRGVSPPWTVHPPFVAVQACA